MAERIVVAGGTGLVGRALVAALLAEGREVVVLSRRPLPTSAENLRMVGWEALPEALSGAAGVVNLAGEGIADHRWTPERKEALLESRTSATAHLVRALEACGERPKVLVNASAVGYYGARDEAPVDEASPAGEGFLPSLCRAWEAEAQRAEGFGMRVVRLRLGVVLAREGGALPQMALPVRRFAGCPLGDGHQGLSWIHLADLVGLCQACLRDPAWAGAVNATAPYPVSQGDLVRALGRRLHRPIWPLPATLTRLLLPLLVGEMARDLLLQGAFVLPRRALDLDFPFRFPTLEGALADLL